ncbi:MAG: hypothetical protein COZ36_03810 [Piscirickettsiaceae bacterium CG_4_10_14_3_um_filter_44_349]|nr:restriction endonuclease subunit S [Thiomicrospira sp.]OIP94076.1 MAG: hypothetical protein AUK56_10095 [Thiomicrospira sp. CG2_30_44_34]PIU38121.1 MAG: hypothetical protein COT01_08235 [Piscirickettsiaceae bacterium CG07_land_8_20_14_0_80_44_28]PIX79727.1 MAG: hypothetical protein COZ36_03810 [Piscirickettsiaceae bacterium CG_4_10_14_3_um_filter_44_349]
MSFDSTTYKLIDAINIIGGGTPKRSNPEFWNGDIPWLSVVDFNSGSRFVSDTVDKITEAGLKGSSTKILDKDDLIISARGTVGCLAQVTKPMAFNQSCYGLSGKEGVVENDYLYYLVKSKVDELKQKTHGAIFDTITRETFNHIEVIIPNDRQTRSQIAKILGDLDKKIELNRQTNQTLEQIAQALFKSWFVDFDPVKAKIAAKQAGGNAKQIERAAMAAISGKTEPELNQLTPDQYQNLKTSAALFPDELVESELGDIPSGWKLSEIGNEVTIVGGGTPSTKNSEFWENGEIHWTTPRDMSNLTDKILLDTDRKITKAGLAKISSGLLPINTVLMSSRAPVGYLAISKIPVAINQGYIAMKCEKELSPEYIVQWAESVMDEIQQRASGTTFAEISKTNFKVIPIIVPNSDLVTEYSKITPNIYEKITESLRETKSLEETRDTLLPKLLSGQIDL